MTKLAVLGAGVMGETILSGLLRAGWSVGDIVATARRPERAEHLEQRHGITVVGNSEAVAGADVVLVAVKPQDIVGVLDEIAGSLRSGAVVASVAAGVSTAVLEAHLPSGTPVVRVTPNTPAQVDEGMAAVSGGSAATGDQVQQIADLLAVCGRAIVVPEKYQDAVTALSGSGPAYLFYVVEALIEGGVHLGLPRQTAAELATQTVYGAAKLLRDGDDHPAVLRERVTSPGGTTAAALRVLDENAVRAAFLEAVEAARDRGRDLSDAAQADAARRPAP